MDSKWIHARFYFLSLVRSVRSWAAFGCARGSFSSMQIEEWNWSSREKLYGAAIFEKPTAQNSWIKMNEHDAKGRFDGNCFAQFFSTLTLSLSLCSSSTAFQFHLVGLALNAAIDANVHLCAASTLKFKCLFNVCRWVDFVVLQPAALSKTRCASKNRFNGMSKQPSTMWMRKFENALLFFRLPALCARTSFASSCIYLFSTRASRTTNTKTISAC